MMKRILSILISVALVSVFSACTDENASDLTAMEKLYQYQLEFEEVVSSAPNGWVMEYFADDEYGGALLFMEFDNGTVSMSSLRGGASYVESSYYSYAYDNGVTLNFDTYNSILHYYSDPNSGVGDSGTGMNGDFEFRIESYSSDEIVLMGKKQGKYMTMTPLSADNSWSEILGDYIDFVNEVGSALVAPTFSLGSMNYAMCDAYVFDYASSYIICNISDSQITDSTIIGDDNMVTAPYILTLDKKLCFYDTIEIDGAKLSEMEWNSTSKVFYNDSVEATISSPELKTLSVTYQDYGTDQVSAAVVAWASGSLYAQVLSMDEYNSYSSENQLMKALASELTESSLSSSYFYASRRNLVPETNYKVVTFSCTTNNLGTVLPSSTLSSYDVTTTAVDQTPNPEYDKWIGTWQVTSTSTLYAGVPVTYNVVVTKQYNNVSYNVYGWDVSTLRWTHPMIAQFDATTNNMIFYNYVEIDTQGHSELDGYVLYAFASCKIPGYSDYTFVLGDYEALTGTLTEGADGTTTALMECYEYSTTSFEFTVNNITLIALYSGYIYSFGLDTSFSGLSSDEVFIGPYAMTKLTDSTEFSSSTGVVSAPASTALNRAPQYMYPHVK